MDSDFTYGQYAGSQQIFGPPALPGSVAITTINGITGPTIDFDGGSSGFTFSPAGTTITLTSPLTTKGDIFTRSSTVGTRLAVGANGDVLTADSGEATGLKWAPPAAAAPLNVVTITAADSPYALTDANDVVLVDATAGVVRIDLTDASLALPKAYYFKKIDASANAMRVDAFAGQTIDGATPLSTAVQYTAFTLVPDGSSEWGIF